MELCGVQQTGNILQLSFFSVLLVRRNDFYSKEESVKTAFGRNRVNDGNVVTEIDCNVVTLD